MVTGDPVQIGQIITSDARIKKISFTVSTAIGNCLLVRARIRSRK